MKNTTLKELKRVGSPFKAGSYFASEYLEMPYEVRNLFISRISHIIDNRKILSLGFEKSKQYNLLDWYAYSCYHYGKHDEVLKCLSDKSLLKGNKVIDTLKEIYSCVSSCRVNEGDSNVIRVAFIDFWGIGNIKCSTIYWILLGLSQKVVVISTPDKADILVYSSYTYFQRQYDKNKILKIYWSSEQDVPELNDYSISFCPINLIEDDTHIRYKPWLGCVIYPNRKNSFYGSSHLEVPISELYNPTFGSVHELEDKKYLTSVIMGNPVKTRIDFIKRIEGIIGNDNILKGGNVYSNKIGSKESALKDCISNICFENAVVPGYITEKLFEAKVAGCIPIYSGHKSAIYDFNPSAFINVDLIEISKPEMDAAYVVELLKDKARCIEMLREPLFVEPPNIIKTSMALTAAIERMI